MSDFDALVDAFLSLWRADEHLPGQHDQADHAGGRISIAQEIRDAGSDVEENGYKVLRKFMGKKSADTTPAMFLGNTGKIYINEKSDYWKSAKQQAQAEFDKGWWSSADEYHPVYHELGHALQNKTDSRHFDNLKNSEIPPVFVERVKSEVSRYAATSPREFVAEVYAGLRSGKTYSEDVMRFYNQWRGPKA